ncbi:lipopolysaccharide biosynthesis protein [Amphritea pacifica]|uniref:lipopolysaccharide biosynthesis protein n=1 Tax=Amphritea pacifica TaxID=2811233 RepID=UPI0019638481|nr:lipopolysaccharide biosynthesis protein [Amphritea pacifica]MBN1005316.1 lipopolysaccharide biosynthesis protein [Amphritea pacifica]
MKAMSQKIGVGVFWNLVSLFMSRGASTVFMLLLARLLAPDAFGLVAMATVVFELTSAFIDSGLGIAIIRSKSVSNRDLNTVFYTNMFLSGLSYIGLFASAPFIASFYSQPELTLLIQAMGLVVFLNATKVVQTAVLSRRMDFKSQMKANTMSVVVSGSLALTAAWFGWGVWSLVVQMLSSATVSAFMLWLNSRWRPGLEFSGESFSRLFGFGKNLLVEGLLQVLFENSYILVIGRFFSAEATGLYFLAKKISNLVSQQLTAAVQQATFPALSTLQDDNGILRYKYRQIMQLMMFIVSPIMALLAGVAPTLFDLLFGERWLASVPYLQLLCIVGILYPVHALNVNLLIVKGRADLVLKVGLLKKTVNLILLFLAIPYGIFGIVVSQVIASFLSLIPNTYFSSDLIGYSVVDQIEDVAKPIISAVVSGFCLYLFLQHGQENLLLWLIGSGFISMLIYLVISYLLGSEGMVLLVKKLEVKIRIARFFR